DGTEVWKYAYRSTFSDPYGYNNGPRCSPVLTETHCVTLGAEGQLVCLQMKDGSLVWQIDLREKFDLPEWFFGVGCSPILDGDRLIVLVGGQPNSGVVAFNVNDGSVLWQHVGQETWDGADTDQPGEKYAWTGREMVVSYSSPIIATIHERRHLLCLVRQGLVSLDPETGNENFHYWFRASVHESVNAARPVVIDNQIFLSAAYRVGSALLAVDSSGTSYQVRWRNEENMLAHWSTPIHADGFLYGFSGRHENEGEMRCVRLTDGEVVWKTAGFDGDLRDLSRNRTTGEIINVKTGKAVPYPFLGRGSLIQCGSRFIVLGERGTLCSVNVDATQYSEVGRLSFPEIGYPAWAAPVVSNRQLYLRSENWLLCLDLSETGAKPAGSSPDR
ncbi:MAG: PQQ-binding-like beta-propeller repeat protein, partial [Planctomycetaceae bacterium]|nr:PQQ-binding-like beta-propeller repeat protein [Planctomycetaceae bacterium]